MENSPFFTASPSLPPPLALTSPSPGRPCRWRGRTPRQGEVSVDKSLFCFQPDSGATSSGVFAGDDPLKFYFPLLLYHVCIVFALSRAIHAVLRRASVPLVISQILAGALLGPSFLGRVLPQVGQLFATPEGWVQINTVGGYAFMLQIFVIGVKTDLGMIAKSGKKAIAIAVFGTAAPHIAMYTAGVALSARVPTAWTRSLMLTSLNSWWSLSAFIVVCCTLDDLNLLSSKLGRLAMSSALIGDFANTFSIAGVTSYVLASSPSEKIQRIGLASLIAFTVFIGFMAFVARPVVLRLMRDVPEGALLSEARLVAVLLITITCSFAGEILGLHATYGPFMLGLMLPGGAPLGVTMAERLDRLVAGVLMPLLFAQGGMRLDIYKMTDASTCLLLEVFLVVGVLAKFVACMLPCLYCRRPLREAFIVGLMMNFKGITEVVYASAFMDAKMFDDQVYATFMINVLVLGATTASVVKYMYHPEEKYVAYRRRTVQHKKLGEELRVLACVHSQVDVAPMLALLDASSPTPVSPIAVYLLHLAPLAGLTSSVLRPFRHGDRNCVPSGGTDSARIVNAFQFFVEQRPQGSSSLLPYVCIAPYATMHDDVCTVALDKRAMLIIVPFHKRLAIDGSVEPTTANAGAVQSANTNILNYCPCSVAILVDRGSLSAVVGAGAAADGFPLRVALYFLGGPDDREALALATHMAEDAPIGLTIFRFVLPPEWRKCGDVEEDRLDEEVLQEYIRRWVDDHRLVYSENLVSGSDEMVAVIRNSSPAFNLLMVGRRAESCESPLTAGISEWSEHLELGVLGDLLTSTDFGCRVSTLVVQQQTSAAAGEICRSPEMHGQQRSDGHV
ncbi:cation/H(+) antiporter 15-like [Phragmites australis]|uniref:cation/H(+) antiporter 15-like n=1 Tax=Phragmites australis TaxID=29695 RepID=UPI002D768133|nr:cation/H(+) antiporter 15-like [Phragmites australis]